MLFFSILVRQVFARVDPDGGGDGGRVSFARPEDDHRSRRKLLAERRRPTVGQIRRLFGRKVGQIHRRPFQKRAEAVRNRHCDFILVNFFSNNFF